MEWNDEKPYAPSSVCTACALALTRWSEKRQEKIPFKSPMMWFDPGNIHYSADCYYCVNTVYGVNTKKRRSVTYNATVFVALPEPHTNMSPPVPYHSDPEPQEDDLEMQPIGSDIEAQLSQRSVPSAPSAPSGPSGPSGPSEPSVPSGPSAPSSSSYAPSRIVILPNKITLVTQSYLNTMCRQLELSQRKSQLLASMLRANNLLADNVTISSQKHRQEAFIQYFITEADLSYCCNITGLFDALKIQYERDDWRLFIDASKSALKAVLLHNENMYKPVPVAYSRNLKETYESMKLIFDKIDYNGHQWDVSGDLKVTALIMGLQLGRTRNMCFICTWISTAKIQHYRATWELRQTHQIGAMNVVRNRLIEPLKMLLPPLHIKLGLVTNYIKALNKNEMAFKYLSVLFPKLSKAKLAAGNIFIYQENYYLLGLIL